MLVALALVAADPAYSLLDRCLNAGDAAQGVMPAIMDCVSAETVRRDRVLNQVYRAVLGRVDRAGRQRLVMAERHWLRTRDAGCRPEDMSQDAALSARWCLLEATERRITVLRAWR